MKTLLGMLIALGASLSLAGCAGAPVRPDSQGGLRLRCVPEDATVILDEEYRGACRLFSARPLPLQRGAHRLEVQADGHFPYYGDLDASGVVQTLEVVLVQRPE